MILPFSVTFLIKSMQPCDSTSESSLFLCLTTNIYVPTYACVSPSSWWRYRRVMTIHVSPFLCFCGFNARCFDHQQVSNRYSVCSCVNCLVGWLADWVAVSVLAGWLTRTHPCTPSYKAAAVSRMRNSCSPTGSSSRVSRCTIHRKSFRSTRRRNRLPGWPSDIQQ